MYDVDLIPLGASARLLSLDDLAEGIQKALPTRVRLRELHIELEETLDPSRQQYHSTLLLVKLLEHAGEGESKLLGITAYDLFIPILTFVFGQAQLNNRAAVFSSFRLHNEFYGLPASGNVLRQRILKEALHELGHTFGLRHCTTRPCVMNSSTYVEDIDLKPRDFCLPCIEHIRLLV